jgi:hypothetical protein
MAYTENGVEKTCHVILDDVTDAYEFSLVAVPAQPRAGVTKAVLKEGRALSSETIKRLSAARSLRMQADDCERQARAIEDELIGGWPDAEDFADDDPNDDGGCNPDDNEQDVAEVLSAEEEPNELKAFRAELELIIGGQ